MSESDCVTKAHLKRHLKTNKQAITKNLVQLALAKRRYEKIGQNKQNRQNTTQHNNTKQARHRLKDACVSMCKTNTQQQFIVVLTCVLELEPRPNVGLRTFQNGIFQTPQLKKSWKSPILE